MHFSGGRAGARITIIAADGTVLGDSFSVSTDMENHGGRPEVLDALRRGEGQSTRLSTTVHRTLAYVAWRQDRGDESRIIRLAIPVDAVAQARHQIRGALWSGVVVAALAALIPAWIMSRRLSRRLSRLAEFSNAVAQGRTPPMLVPEGDDTVSRLQSDLLAMADSLGMQLRAAREEKDKLEGVLGGMVEGVLVIDRHGTIRLVNQRAQQLFARGSREILPGEPLIHIVRDPELQEIVRAVMRGDTERPLIREITIEGRERDSLQVTASAIGDGSDGGPELYVLVFHDVTNLKRLEATRRDFVANVSHELRTPLTAIRGYAETLREGALSDPALARKFIGIIERHSERLSRLIEDLLSLSDLELGRTELRREPVKLDTCVEAAIEILRDKAEHGRVEIRREVSPDVPPIYADADRVEQVLVNLIDNAVKYTPSGGQVRVMAATVGAGKRECRHRSRSRVGPRAGFASPWPTMASVSPRPICRV